MCCVSHANNIRLVSPTTASFSPGSGLHKSTVNISSFTIKTTGAAAAINEEIYGLLVVCCRLRNDSSWSGPAINYAKFTAVNANNLENSVL